jgi:hypothetical protein
MRFPAGNEADGIGALPLAARRLDGFVERPAAGDQGVHVVHHDLGIGFRRKAVTGSLHARAYRLVVFDYAVVDDADFEVAARGEMRMRIRFRRRAVRRPARMGQAGPRLHALAAHEFVEVGDAPGGTQTLEPAVLVDERDPGRVVAAVLQFADALDQQLHHIARGRRADYSAHVNSVMSNG